MARVNLRILVSATLIGKYTNSRVVALKNGSIIAVPTKYYVPMVELTPHMMQIPDVDYEFLIDRSKEVMVSCQYHPDYIKYTRYVKSIDITGIKADDKIPVNEVPMEYVTIDDKYIQQSGDDDDDSFIDDDFDDDDDLVDDEEIEEIDDDKPLIESICRYTSPNFEFQTADWKINVRLYDYQFVQDKPEPETEKTVHEHESWSIKSLVDKILHR